MAFSNHKSGFYIKLFTNILVYHFRFGLIDTRKVLQLFCLSKIPAIQPDTNHGY